jgi:single-strand DNA-binding protein
MSSLNKVQLIGNLGRTPELHHLPDGTPVVTVSIATTESWKDKQTGQKKEATEWHRVVFFRGLAEVVGQYLVKGSTVYVEGTLKTRKYQDRDGEDRYVAEVRATELRMLGGKRKDPGAEEAGEGQKYRDEVPEDDVPF